MKNLEFSLPEMFDKIKIIGVPTVPWNKEKSGEELYNILKNNLPMGTYDNLQKRMAVELLLQSYPEAGDLEKLRKEFDELRINYNFPNRIRSSSFYEILGEAIKEWEVRRTVELLDKNKKNVR